MVNSLKELQTRQLEILLEIIQYYLDRHEAISARTLSKFSRLELSPTTIRNLMEDLSSDGFLTSEGVTRGRIPTQKAFAFFVTTLPLEQMVPEMDQGIVYPLREDEDGDLLPLEEAMKGIGRMLARETGFIVLAALPEKEVYPLNWVRLVEVADDKLMVAVQSVYGDLWCKVVRASANIPVQLLRELEGHFCRVYHRVPIDQIREEIMSGSATSLLGGVDSLGAALRLLRRAFEWEREPGWLVWGRENLYKVPEYQQPEQLVLLHRALNDPELLSHVLSGGRELEGGRVSIGTETGYPGLETSALVTFPFGEGDWQGTLAVLGPMRMDYGLVFSQVSQAARALSTHLSELSTQARPASC